jgi:hypothetical protein
MSPMPLRSAKTPEFTAANRAIPLPSLARAGSSAKRYALANDIHTAPAGTI